MYYHESIDNYIKLCKHDDYKWHLWIKINLVKENIYMVACNIPHKESNYYSRFVVERDDPFTNLCQDILVFEKLGKVLIMGDFNARVGKYHNVELLRENIVDPCLLCDSKDCIVTNNWRILIHILDCTNLIVLNSINVFPFTCLLASHGGSVVDYVLMKAYDLSIHGECIYWSSIPWLGP